MLYRVNLEPRVVWVGFCVPDHEIPANIVVTTSEADDTPATVTTV